MQTRALQFALWIGILIGAAAQVGRAQTAPPLNGNWKGVYFTYPHLIAIELTLQSSGEGVTGELKFSPAVAQRSGFSLPPTGKYAVNGVYDEFSYNFSLKPGAWIDRPAMGHPLLALSGVFDSRTRQLAGIFGNSTPLIPVFFVLAPDAEGDRLIADIARSAYPTPPAVRGAAMTNPAVREQMRRSLTMRLEQMEKIKPPPGAEAQFEAREQQLRDQLAALSPPENGGDTWQAPSVEKILAWASRLKEEAASRRSGTRRRCTSSAGVGAPRSLESRPETSARAGGAAVGVVARICLRNWRNDRSAYGENVFCARCRRSDHPHFRSEERPVHTSCGKQKARRVGGPLFCRLPNQAGGGI